MNAAVITPPALSLLTTERLREILNYDPLSGLFTWKARVARAIHVGDRAGCGHHRGYLVISIGGRQYGAHRLAWQYVHGTTPRAIDHINGDPSDNRIANLRPADESQNGANRKLNANNRFRLKGVSTFQNSEQFRASIGFNGTIIYLGLFSTPAAAHAAYCAAARRLFGEFARAS